MKRFAGVLVALGLVGIVATFVLWQLPANDFIFLPDPAKPLADRVEVQGGQPRGKGDVYFVEVFIRRMRRLEQLLPFTRPDGTTVVPAQIYAPAGESDADRARESREEMERSEQIASAVALRTLGYKVVATPNGVLVTSVAADAPANKVLKAEDVIVGVDGVPVRTTDELRSQVGRKKPGGDVRLTVRRNGKVLDVTVRTIASPTDPKRAIIGILVDQDAKIVLPIDVNIDLGSVGGPSAGLAFALEIARQLHRNVTHGCRIAATGELALDGEVLPIGGIKQKTIGARRAGVDLFLVPNENTEAAKANAADLPIIPVDSYQQALRKLATTNVKC